MTAKYQLGTVPYSNVEPLIWEMQNTPEITLESAVPRVLAEQFASGKYDVALIPVFAGFKTKELHLVSDACIACNGPVESVVLFSHVPLRQIKTVYLDTASLTSVNLLKVLMAESDLECDFFDSTAASDIIDKNSALLIIGDNALKMRGSYPVETDLGAWWKELTGLGFIFAGWHSRIVDPELIDFLQNHRDSGINNLAEVAQHASVKHGLPFERLYRYYNNAIRFKIGREERDGLQMFHFLCLKYGRILE